MLKLEDDLYTISYNKDDFTVYFNGSIRLWDPVDYEKIRRFLLDVYELEQPKLLLDLTQLEFLNSSGISMLCKFIFDVKQANKCPVGMIGSEAILWQKKSLTNLQKIWDQLELEIR